MTLGSLFDGIAGFPLAASRYGIKTIWASEIEENLVDIVKTHFPDIKHLGDIKRVDGSRIEPVDIISFGSPCQNLSVAGNQKGLDGEKSMLFFEAIRIIYEMRGATNGKYPRFIIWENVAGAFSSNKGQDFRRVLEEITKSYIPMPNSRKWANSGLVRNGETTTAWRMLDAQYWGVPQRRKRIYLVHDFNGECAGQILFEWKSLCRDTTQSKTEREKTSRNSGNGIAGKGMGTKPETYVISGNIIGRQEKNGGHQLGINKDICFTLTATDRHAVAAPEPFRLAGYGYFEKGVGTLRAKAGDNGGGSETLIVEKEKYFLEAYQHHGYRVSGVANTQTAGANSSIRGDTSLIIEKDNTIVFDDLAEDENGHKWGNICRKCVEQYGIDESLLDEAGQGTCSVKDCWNEADYYIDIPDNKNLDQIKSGKAFLLKEIITKIKHRVRRLTPTECERLDGFPDDWTRYGASGKEMSDNVRYTALGNSIAIPCAERVFAGITAVEREIKENELLLQTTIQNAK